MAIAVALRFATPAEDEIDAAISIARLLRSPFSRTRYRAAQTAAYRANHGASDAVRAVLWDAAKVALQTEECQSVLLTLCEVMTALRAQEKSDLNSTEQRIWNLLAYRIRSAKDLAWTLYPNMRSEEDSYAAQVRVRQTISRMKRKGCDIKTTPGSGYWRSDAPPKQ
jgi:hypothetical protein